MTDARDDGHAQAGDDLRGERAGDSCAASGADVLVRSLKEDGRVQRSWPARFVRREGTLLVLEGVFETEVRHAALGHIRVGTHSAEYYWTDRWYSVFRFREPAGALRNYYCNVNRPASFDGRTLSYVDLDIDVLVAPDFTCAVLDEDEFAANAARYGYTDEVLGRVAAARAELLRLVAARAFPFDQAS